MIQSGLTRVVSRSSVPLTRKKSEPGQFARIVAQVIELQGDDALEVTTRDKKQCYQYVREVRRILEDEGTRLFFWIEVAA